MIKKRLGILLCMTVTVFTLTGCQGSSQSAAEENMPLEERRGGWGSEDGGIFGQVTSVNENEITLALVEMNPNVNRDSGGNGAPNGRPRDGSGGNGAPSDRPKDGSGKSGSGMGRMNTTGEEQTITVSGETTYMINEMGESKEASLKDVEEGKMVRVLMDGDTVTSVTIMNMGQRANRDGKPPKNQES